MGKKTVIYNHQQLVDAYNAWVSDRAPRYTKWHVYCDIRDGVEIGTSEQMYADYDKRSGPRHMDKETYDRIMGMVQ